MEANELSPTGVWPASTRKSSLTEMESAQHPVVGLRTAFSSAERMPMKLFSVYLSGNKSVLICPTPSPSSMILDALLARSETGLLTALENARPSLTDGHL